MTDDFTKDSTEDALVKTVEAEEYERAGRKVRRSNLRTLFDVSREVGAEERTRSNGNILERAQHCAVKR